MQITNLQYKIPLLHILLQILGIKTNGKKKLIYSWNYEMKINSRAKNVMNEYTTNLSTYLSIYDACSQ